MPPRQDGSHLLLSLIDNGHPDGETRQRLACGLCLMPDATPGGRGGVKLAQA